MSELCTISISTSQEILQYTLNMSNEVVFYQNIKNNDTLDTNLCIVVYSSEGSYCYYFLSLGHCLKIPLQALESQRRLVESLVREKKQSLVREKRSIIRSAQYLSLNQS